MCFDILCLIRSNCALRDSDDKYVTKKVYKVMSHILDAKELASNPDIAMIMKDVLPLLDKATRYIKCQDVQMTNEINKMISLRDGKRISINRIRRRKRNEIA